MKRTAKLSILLFVCLRLYVLADEKPNILWITSEDNAAHWMGCYGNQQARTPSIDALASRGVRFTRAYSNAPVCAVARCTLLHGVYSVTLGTQHMRSRHPIPESIRPYVSYLREQGYYCSNNRKTDYNRAGNDKTIWDECGNKAHYRNRKKGQPFFAVFNLTVCHESSLFPDRVAKNREKGLIPEQTRLTPDEIDLPPYLPDLPEIRRDFAIYHDNLTAMDRQVHQLLMDLDKGGLSEDTIVFYYSDHGGPTPRGKRYLADTGVHIPMIVYIPPKWQELSPFAAGSSTDEPVAFVDLAPTLLSLADLSTPAHMHGRAFLGKHRRDSEDDFVFLFGDRFDELIGMRRAVTDGKYKYIRRFMPHLPAAPYSYYQFSMPSWKAWRSAWNAGQLPAEFNAIWTAPQPPEFLYDLEKDPWETVNLAMDPEHSEVLATFRRKLTSKMDAFLDSGVIPESMFHSLSKKTVYQSTHDSSFRYAPLRSAAQTATSGKASNDELRALLESDNQVIQYWGTIGCATNGIAAKELRGLLEKLTHCDNATLRISAAIALAQLGDRDRAKIAIQSELDRTLTSEESIVMCNAFFQLQCGDLVPIDWIERNLDNPNEYVRRFANRLKSNKQLQPN